MSRTRSVISRPNGFGKKVGSVEHFKKLGMVPTQSDVDRFSAFGQEKIIFRGFNDK